MRSIVFAALLALALQQCSATPVTTFAEQSGKFSLSLYKTVVGAGNENVVISPVSVNTALGLAYMGAAGSTAAEMSRVMHLDSSQEVAATKFKTLLDNSATSGAVKIANKFYVAKDFVVKPAFSRIATEEFRSSAEGLDTSNGEQAARTVNSWVESKTNNKIQNLVSASDVQGAVSVLVNAVYFKADWVNPFNKFATRKQDFWTSNTVSKQVDMMYVTSQFQFGDFDGIKVVNMPYKNSDFSLLVVLPHERESLRAVETKLEQMSVKEMLNSLDSDYVEVALPKFKTEFKVEMQPVLTEMGMGTMFSPGADFSNLSEMPVRVSNVIHKAVLEVDEKGTEAAAATVVTFARKSLMLRPDPKRFIADHPFLYLLVDSDGNIFFMGRYVK